MRVVMKFGGTSVGSAAAIRQVAKIAVESHHEHEVVLVVSAMNAPDLRTTDTLIAAAKAAAEGDGDATAEVAPRLLAMHMEAAAALATPSDCATLEVDLRSMLDYLSNLSRSIAILGELTPRALDLFSGLGERMNARLIAAALRGAGLDALALDATELIVTDDRFGMATPLMNETREQARACLQPLLIGRQVPVVTGFIGATKAGVPTTLGRGGSDYSCSILGAVLDADEVWFWKEVDGVLSANPKLVPEARTMERLSYSEMGEMAYYGANVLHPKTVQPLVQRRIPIRIRNTFNPAHPGTIISAEPGSGTAKAVTAIKDVSLITVGGPGMLGLTGVAARIFGAVARAGSNNLLISQASSEQSVCFAVARTEAAAAVAELRAELANDFSAHDVEHIGVIECTIIAVVGSGMRGTPGIAGRIFGSLGDAGVNIIAVAQGSTENNISLVVAPSEGDEAVRAIHRSFSL
ncbi:aspartate kinase [Candidatus Viridilinea mediisalina]|uniref:Aspartokinase n=1 Tax=Candidatus Viridilinea mediisalina TaxID=2024553 RepID=A0A2A6RI72_9CHLR|nr:aspartate kinase [Candidatus Viridilinea mediisalina]PDW02641.1 aspartate kinase [Candidatus Viridilinea mediisalina]